MTLPSPPPSAPSPFDPSLLLSSLFLLRHQQQDTLTAVAPALADARFPFTFDRVEQPYHFSVIEGWPPERDRDLSKYIRPGENTVVSDTGCLRLQRVRLLIVVKSSIDDPAQRDATRETYATYTRQFAEVKVINLLGRRPDQPELEQQVVEEQKRFCDIVQMDFIDHYNNLTLKSVSALKFVLSSRRAHRRDTIFHTSEFFQQ